MENLNQLRFSMEERPLTNREEEILQLISQGFSTNAIAKQLHLSINTVKSHRRNLFRKMGANNMAVLIRRGLECGAL